MFTKNAAIRQVRQFLAECSRLPVKIDRAILFGSVVNGKTNKYSDIDVALFSEDFTDNILLNIDMIGRVNIRYPNIDVHTYPSRSYNGHGLLIDEIKHTGVEII